VKKDPEDFIEGRGGGAVECHGKRGGGGGRGWPVLVCGGKNRVSNVSGKKFREGVQKKKSEKSVFDRELAKSERKEC